ncbi:hypothetical protein N7532_001003 [Penicillium argentinense]|uniref:Brl1/Brr6 domain-containing protein n=1 Tax=Penicillium argentinense TaxID=1131581 RepID=A0A9W9G1P8_9EURO|nr:uncharacterized protein N7532_001003 [Penicillium argentinense]KAJ5110468.1 hypothetical protein N7532_001003 [Penicillium argentinense]
MEPRTAESPMEFEWQHKPPGDASSGFYQVGLQSDNKKRTYSAFGSPEKTSVPGLRAPNSHPFLFSQPASPSPFTSQPASQTPRFGQSAWTTPRKPVNLDFSSGAENFSSPENADNEDTPEQPVRTERQNSLFNTRGRFTNASPGRGEIRKNHYSTAAARRVLKRRQRDKELDRRIRVDSDDDSDRPSSNEGLRGKPAKQGKEMEPGISSSNSSSLSQLFTFLEAHPHMPSILSWWAQLMVNLCIFSVVVYVIWSVVSSIRAEFAHAADLASMDIRQEITQCSREYLNNRCADPNRPPALTPACKGWEDCMDRDPAKIGRAKISAHTMAQIINGFIEPISWKAVVIFLASISTVTVVSNWSLSAIRHSLDQRDNGQYYPQQPPNYNHQQPMLQHQPSFGYHPQQVNRKVSDHAYAEKENAPLLLESTPFITERSREREAHLRTPSPSKRNRQFS